VHVALPGAVAESVVVELQPGAITISARRSFPLSASESQLARIHALEIPYGRFERRIGLPTQALLLAGRKLQDGCLTLTFSKKKEST
jgi:HSP20 family protein